MRLHNPTGRNTKAHIVETASASWYFSYNTCIAIRPYGEGKPVRVRNSWGPTTGRHFNELGCADFEVVDQDTFDALATELGG